MAPQDETAGDPMAPKAYQVPEETGIHFSNTQERAKILRDIEARKGYKERVCCGGLWEELTLIDEDVDKNRHMTWSELFYDLIFVTAVARVGDEMKEGKFDAYVYTLYMVVIFGCWHSATCFGCRFHRGDLSQKIFFALHMMGMTAIIMCLPNSWWPPDKRCEMPNGYSSTVHYECVKAIAPHMPTFCFCLSIIHVIEILGHSRVWYRYIRFPMAWYELETNRRMMRQSGKRVVEHVVPFCTWVALAMGWIPGHYFIYGFFVDLLFRSDNFLVWTFLRFIQKLTCIPDSWFEYWAMMPIHVDHYTERLGLVVLIVLGESVDGIAVSGHFSTSLVTTVVLAYIVIFGMKLLYFDCMIMEGEEHLLFASSHKTVVSKDESIKEVHGTMHALIQPGIRRERVLCPHLRGSTWICSHQFLAASVAMMGDALAVLAKYEKEKGEAHGGHFEAAGHGMGIEDARQVLCCAMGGTLLITAYIGLSHDQENLRPENPNRHIFAALYYVQLFTIVIIAIAAILLQYVDVPELSNMQLIGFFATCSLFISALFYVDECCNYRLQGDEDEENEEEKQSLLAPSEDVNIDALLSALSAFNSPAAKDVSEKLKAGKASKPVVTTQALAEMIAHIPMADSLAASSSFKDKGSCCF